MDMTRLDDYEIRDIDQDIHGIVFQHPFPLAHSQHRCAIRSGALIKFKNATVIRFGTNSQSTF